MALLTNKKFQLFFIIVATALAYSNIFTNDFVWDDQFFIQEWEKVRDWKYLPDMLQGELPPRFSGAFRPLLGVFYLVFYQLFGTNPFGWHLQSLVVHVANTVLVYFIVARILEVGGWKLDFESSKSRILDVKKSIRQLTDQGQGYRTSNFKDSVPFVSALLFGLHPIHTEAVTYIAASINTIGALFFFTSFYLYLRARNFQFSIFNFQLLLSLFFAALAFFTYEFTLTLPLLILLHHVILDRNVILSTFHKVSVNSAKNFRKRSFAATLLRMTRVSIPYFAIAGVYVFLRVFVVHIGGRGEYLLGSFPLTMLTMTKAFLRYVELLILPINQTVFHTLPGSILTNVYINLRPEAISNQSLFDPYVLFSVILAISLVATAVVTFDRGKRLITFAIGWFFISLLPASNIIPVQEIMAERYAYVPSFSFVLLFAAIAQSATLRLRPVPDGTGLRSGRERKAQNYSAKVKTYNALRFTPWLFAFSLSLFALFYGYLTYQRNTVWQSNFTLWIDTTKKSPLSEIAHYNLGNAYVRKGDFDGALVSYKRAIVNKPASMGSWINMGHIYLDRKDFVNALDAYEHALAIDPNSPSNHNNVGVTLMELGRDQVALEHFLLALLIDRNYEQARGNVNALIRRNPNFNIQETLDKLTQGT